MHVMGFDPAGLSPKHAVAVECPDKEIFEDFSRLQKVLLGVISRGGVRASHIMCRAEHRIQYMSNHYGGWLDANTDSMEVHLHDPDFLEPVMNMYTQTQQHTWCVSIHPERPGSVVFHFTNPRDAVKFKLAHGAA